MKKQYYIEIVIKDYESDPPYAMQSTTFDTQKEAIKWFQNNWDYIDRDALTVSLMVMNFFNEDEYDIDFVKEIE